MGLNKIIDNARIKSELEDAEHNARMKRDASENQKRLDSFQWHHFKKATVEDYKNWLKGYLEKGGQITHYYDYKMRPDGLYCAISNFEEQPLYGSSSISIIVPVGIERLQGDSGHNNLYFMEKFENNSNFVPVYKNIVF